MPPITAVTPLRHTCRMCLRNFNANQTIVHDGRYYCNDCFDDSFCTCESCNQYHLTISSIRVCGYNFCCHECAAVENFYRCNGCGDYYHTDDMDDNLCGACNINDSIIQDNDYKPSKYVYAKMPWENTTYLGIELEMESNNEPEDDAASVMEWLKRRKLDHRVYIKYDGSLDNGFEIVFHPTTLNALERKFPVKAFLSYLRKLDMEAQNTCGLHVHISRKDLSDNMLQVGKVFFYKCQDHLIKLSARTELNYCKFDKEMPLDGKTQRYGKYSALNTSASRDTIEIRIFRSTLRYDRFQASMQFSDMFGEYIKKTPVDKIMSVSNVWSDFLTFGKRKKKYRQFLEYVEKNNII